MQLFAARIEADTTATHEEKTALLPILLRCVDAANACAEDPGDKARRDVFMQCHAEMDRLIVDVSLDFWRAQFPEEPE